MDIELGNPVANYEKVDKLTKEIMQKDKQTKVIVLPELWTTGYTFDQMKTLASPGGKDPANFLSKLSKEYRVWFIGGSVLASISTGYVNRAQVINPNGSLVATYDKVHLFGLMNEDQFFVNGKKITLFDLDDITASCVICYDIRFCEFITKIALSKAKILFVSAEWPHPRLDHWRILLRARAIENQMYVIACNRVGKTGKTVFFGNSMIINPWGEIITEICEEKEKTVIADIDLSIVEKIRKKIPIFKDRKPEVYL